MNYRQVEFIAVIFSLFFSIATSYVVHFSNNGHLKYQCTSTSVKIFFMPRPSYASTIIANHRIKDCERNFQVDEEARFKLDFNQCTLGFKNFPLIVSEYRLNQTDSLSLHKVYIDCRQPEAITYNYVQ